MAGRGPAPKAERQRPSDTKARTSEMTKLATDQQLRGPDLPEGEWHQRTVDWFSNWRRSAVAQTFVDTDWDFLIDTAVLHSEMWNGNLGHAAELRLRVGKLAGTPEDRLRMRITIDKEEQQAATARSMTDDRKARLLAIVNE